VICADFSLWCAAKECPCAKSCRGSSVFEDTLGLEELYFVVGDAIYYCADVPLFGRDLKVILGHKVRCLCPLAALDDRFLVACLVMGRSSDFELCRFDRQIVDIVVIFVL